MISFEFLSSIIGIILGVTGLAVGFIQWRQTKSIEKLRREQLLATINRAKFLIIPNEVIEKILEEDNPESKETLRQWLWSLHKGASDNYVSTVFYYLSLEDKFTYDDLEYAKKCGIITNKWEENIWRSLIGLRPENRKKGINIPDFYYDKTNFTVKLPSKDKDEVS